MEYSNSSGVKSPFSPRLQKSLGGQKSLGMTAMKRSQSKSVLEDEVLTGDVIYKTPQHVVETYGSPLPVMVTEALAFASGEVSVRLSSCGWCWLVAGRRVLAWPHRAPAPPAARELTLPQTDLAHKADLVMLYYETGAQMPSCVGVSPEGVVRYWPSVTQESVYVDESAELAGQECELLTEPSTEGLVLATTTCTVVLLTPHTREGHPGVACRALRPPGGWLGGLGRRVSLLIFGSMPAHLMDTRLVGVAVVEANGGEPCVALVARGPVLQLWRRGPELLEHDLRRPLRDALAHSHPAHQGDTSGVELLALQVRAAPSGLQLLLAAADVARPSDTYYAIAHVCLEDAATPRVTSLTPVQRASAGPDGEPLRFLCVSGRTLFYTARHLAIVCGRTSDEHPDLVSVSAAGDRILAAELCANVPLLFTRAHGLLRLTPVTGVDSSHIDLHPSSSHTPDLCDGNLSFYEIDPHEVDLVSTDACGKLKTAFLYHVRRDAVSSRALLEELFPVGSGGAPPSPQRRAAPPPPNDVDAALDRTVVTVAREVLDDVPAGDPRWRQTAAGSGVPLGSSSALQITAQLRDKQRAFGLFVEFLRATGLWQRLQYISCENGCGCVRTRGLLSEFPERLAAASALRRLQRGPDAPLIDAALQHVVHSGEESEVEELVRSGVLSAADAVYRRVSRIARVLLALCRLARTTAPSTAPHHLHRAAVLLLTAVDEVRKCRAQWASAVGDADTDEDAHGAHTWTAHLAADSLLAELAQLQLAVARCARSCSETSQRGQLYEQAVALARLVLEEAAYLVRAPRTAPRYEAMRRDAIRPLLEDGQHERAALLAETFRDFELLVEICVCADDFERLYRYIEKHSDEGLAEVSFAWLAERGGAGAAQLVRRLGARYPRRLAAWLSAAPARAPLLALHHLTAQRCLPAARALHELALDESHDLHRMTTASSLAKLCLVAAEGDDADAEEERARLQRDLEKRLVLAEHHAALPRDVRLHHGLASTDSTLLSPRELLEMYVTTDSPALTEYDYKKALDLADLVDDPFERNDLRLQVWCATLRSDEWEACRPDAPHDVLTRTTYFRLVDLVHQLNEPSPPPVDVLLAAPAARAFAEDDRFQFLLRYGYESVQRDRDYSPHSSSRCALAAH